VQVFKVLIPIKEVTTNPQISIVRESPVSSAILQKFQQDLCITVRNPYAVRLKILKKEFFKY
jgi:hypothetical protein